MHEIETLAKNQEEAIKMASAKSEIPIESLEVVEEYEPDEIDLKQYAEENSLTEVPSGKDVTLYVVRVIFQHYLQEAQEWTQGLIERFAPGAKAEAVRFRNIIIVRLDVPEASILIGKQGATLDALQHVVVRALLTIDENFPDVMLDVERYREKKLMRLEKEARNAADRALRTGRWVPLAPMAPAERKFIHNLLKDMEGVKTESRGVDRRRHIVVEPLNPRGGQGRGAGGGGGKARGERGGERGGNREFDGNRADSGNRSGGGGGQGGGGNRGKGGNQGGNQAGPNRGNKKAGITDEQRDLLYGDRKGNRSEFEDNNLEEEKKSLLPEYTGGEGPLDDDDEDDGQLKFMDEIDDQLR
ncbi:hypothetical protein BH09SUM1_BH09SUM1_01730 [soil metagenome]